MTTNGLVWEDPPESANDRAYDWSEILADLRERPHSWARVRIYADRSGARTADRQQRSKLPAGYELRSTSAGMKGKSALYARYVGEASGPPT